MYYEHYSFLVGILGKDGDHYYSHLLNLITMKVAILSLILLLGYTSAFAQPANDEPCGAITIPVESTGCVPSTVYSYTGATFSTAQGNTFCNGVANRDVWY